MSRMCEKLKKNCAKKSNEGLFWSNFTRQVFSLFWSTDNGLLAHQNFQFACQSKHKVQSFQGFWVVVWFQGTIVKLMRPDWWVVGFYPGVNFINPFTLCTKLLPSAPNFYTLKSPHKSSELKIRPQHISTFNIYHILYSYFLYPNQTSN